MSLRKNLIMSLVVAAMSTGALAQDQGNNAGGQGGQGGQGQRGQGGQRGNWDPAQMQQRMLDGIKEQLKAPEDEWKVLEPKLSAVMTAQRNARVGMGGFGGRGGNRGGDNNNNQPQTELAKASNDLRELLKQENPAAEQLTSRLTAFRAARTKAEAELKTARTSLQEVLTERQEAVLVTMGMLE